MQKVKEFDRLGKNRKQKECSDVNGSEIAEEDAENEGQRMSLATVGIAATANHTNRNTDEGTSRIFYRIYTI